MIVDIAQDSVFSEPSVMVAVVAGVGYSGKGDQPVAVVAAAGIDMADSLKSVD